MTPEVKLFLDVERAVLGLFGAVDDGTPRVTLKEEGGLWLALFSFESINLSGIGTHEDEALLALLERAHEVKLGSDFNVYVDLSQKGHVWVEGTNTLWSANFAPHGSKSSQTRQVTGRSDDACILRLWLDLHFSYN